MQFVSSTTRFLREHIHRTEAIRFVISLILATFLWGWVTQHQDPVQTRLYSEIPITVEPLPNTLQVVTSLPQASFRITGPKSLLNQVLRGNVTATLDTHSITKPGEYKAQVHVTSGVDGVSVTQLEPREVAIQVEETISRNLPLTIVKPQPPASDPRRVASVTPETSEVTISGPQNIVNRVAKVILPIDIQTHNTSFTTRFQPYAVDSEGQKVVEVDIRPQNVSTFVEVETRGKTVSVVPQTQGTPAQGYSLIQTTANPQTVVVDGPAEALKDLLFVETQPVNIEGAHAPLAVETGLVDLPPGVTVLDPAGATVEVTVVIQEVGVSQTLSDQQVTVNGVGKGLNVRVDPGSIKVTIDAPPDVLKRIKPGDVKVAVDVRQLGPGVYELRPDITLPSGTRLVGSDPPTVRVTIEQPATPGSATPTQ